jgi:cytochrome b561
MTTSSPWMAIHSIDIREKKLNAVTYTPVAKGLHWLMAVLILGLLSIGLYMADLPLSPQKLELYSWHKWAGVTVFVLVWLRLAWRVTHRPPALPEGMSPLMRLAAHAGHAALYGLMVVIPLSGWLMSSAKGFQTVWFGVLPIPDLIGKDKALGDLLKEVHEALNWLLMLTLAGHVLAALWHHFVLKDDTLRRMR